MIDTTLYTVVRGEALLKAKGKEPPATRWNEMLKKPVPIRPDANKHKCITLPRAIPTHRTLDATRWLALALAGDNSRPALTRVWKQGERCVSADGFRLHCTREPVADALEWSNTATHEGSNVPDFMALVRRAGEHRARVDTHALYAACHTVLPIAKRAGENHIAHLEMAPEWLTLSAVSYEFGDARARIEGDEWHYAGPVITFGVNLTYLLDALRGMESATLLDVVHPEKPILLSNESDTRTALVMPVYV